jgi:FlaA1/EpsC-like NDP-sugar epimerase
MLSWLLLYLFFILTRDLFYRDNDIFLKRKTLVCGFLSFERQKNTWSKKSLVILLRPSFLYLICLFYLFLSFSPISLHHSLSLSFFLSLSLSFPFTRISFRVSKGGSEKAEEKTEKQGEASNEIGDIG